MQLNDLVKPIEEQTDEELRERLFAIRHRRETERPAAQTRVKKAARKESKKKMSAAEKMLSELPADVLAALLQEMGE